MAAISPTRDLFCLKIIISGQIWLFKYNIVKSIILYFYIKMTAIQEYDLFPVGVGPFKHYSLSKI